MYIIRQKKSDQIDQTLIRSNLLNDIASLKVQYMVILDAYIEFLTGLESNDLSFT